MTEEELSNLIGKCDRRCECVGLECEAHTKIWGEIEQLRESLEEYKTIRECM